MKLHLAMNRPRGPPPVLPIVVPASSAPGGAPASASGSASASFPGGASASPIVVGRRSPEATPVTRGEKSKRSCQVPSVSPQAAEAEPCGASGLQTPPSAITPSSRSRLLRSSDGEQTFERGHHRRQSMSTPLSQPSTGAGASSGYLADVSSNLSPLKPNLPTLDEKSETGDVASAASASSVPPEMPPKLRPLVNSLGNRGVIEMYAAGNSSSSLYW